MRRVLVGTPCYDGKVQAEFMHAMIESVKLAPVFNVALFPVQVSYDGLVQRARNDIVQMALDAKVHDVIFIDADQEWNPLWIFKLLSHPVDVVGGGVPKKSDVPMFNVKALGERLRFADNGLLEVASVGTGFLRVSAAALRKVWEASEPYRASGTTKAARMVFDVKVVDGELVSEDNILCEKWRNLGGQVWLDPTVTCNHIGNKTYRGDILGFIQSVGMLEGPIPEAVHTPQPITVVDPEPPASAAPTPPGADQPQAEPRQVH